MWRPGVFPSRLLLSPLLQQSPVGLQREQSASHTAGFCVQIELPWDAVAVIIARLIAPTRWRACWAHHRDPFGSYKDLVNEAFAMYRNKASLYRNKGWDWLKASQWVRHNPAVLWVMRQEEGSLQELWSSCPRLLPRTSGPECFFLKAWHRKGTVCLRGNVEYLRSLASSALFCCLSPWSQQSFCCLSPPPPPSQQSFWRHTLSSLHTSFSLPAWTFPSHVIFFVLYWLSPFLPKGEYFLFVVVPLIPFTNYIHYVTITFIVIFIWELQPKFFCVLRLQISNDWKAEEGLLLVKGQPGLHCEFQESLGYRIRPCLNKTKPDQKIRNDHVR